MYGTDRNLSVKDVARKYNCDPQVVRSWAESGLLPGFDASRPDCKYHRWRFSEADLQEMENKRSNQNRPAAKPVRRKKTRQQVAAGPKFNEVTGKFE